MDEAALYVLKWFSLALQVATELRCGMTFVRYRMLNCIHKVYFV